MMRFLKALALILGLTSSAAANQYFNTPVTSTTTGLAWSSQAGQFYVAASSANVSSVTANVPTKSTWTITLNGVTGTVTATKHVGDGSGLTGIAASQIGGGISTAAVTTAALTGNGNSTSPLGVNSSSVPVFQSGSYPPASGAAITALTAANISAGTAGINISGNAGTATTAAALTTAGSAASSGYVARGVDASGNALTAYVDPTTGGVSSSTSPASAGALFASQALDAKIAGVTLTGASGITNAAFTATGANGNIISASSITTTSGLFGKSLQINGIASGTQCLHADSSGNVTGTGSDCGGAANAVLTATQTFSGGNTFNGAAGSTFTTTVQITTLTVTGVWGVPTRQVFLSGSGATYTTPTNPRPRQLRIREVGGGGGGSGDGGGAGGAAGSNGGDTSFNSIVASHGIGGTTYATGTGGAGGSGGSGTGTSQFRLPGGSGGGSGNNDSQLGGNSAFGGSGVSKKWNVTAVGGAAGTNTGGGGAGGTGGGGAPGTGGGAGEYVEFIINAPAASYTYTVGTSGGGGAGGTSGGDGGAGAAGIIIVDEFY